MGEIAQQLNTLTAHLGDLSLVQQELNKINNRDAKVDERKYTKYYG